VLVEARDTDMLTRLPGVKRRRPVKVPLEAGSTFPSRILGAARRNQSNYPEQNDRPDEGG
jgi:hypothetical protein